MENEDTSMYNRNSRWRVPRLAVTATITQGSLQVE